jgi:hypothetical protein
MTRRIVNPAGRRVAHPARSPWAPPPPTPAMVFVHGEFAAPTPELLRRVLEGLQRLNTTR